MQRKKLISDEKKVVVKSLVDAGMPYRTVNEVTGVSLGLITKIVKEFEANRELVEWYRGNKVNILLKMQVDNLALQNAIRGSVTEEELKGWTPDQKQRWFMALGTDFGIKYDKERLESGQSTENVAVIVGAIKEWKKKRREMSKEEVSS